MRTKLIHFRNDDVRGTLDKSLIEITNLFITYNVPITHVVEPANVSKDVVYWLINLKKEYPNLIEIGQHGYEHINKNNDRAGEFGGQRTFQEQLIDLKKGKDLMNQYFGNLWAPIITFPFGGVNIDTFRAADDLGFKIVNGGYGKGIKRQMLYTIGHVLRANFIFGKRVSWNLSYKPRTNLFEIDINIGFIQEYINEDTECIFRTLKDMKNHTKKYFDQKIIGLLLHHRYHNTLESIRLVGDYLKWITELENIQFVTQEEIFNLYG